MGNRHSLKEMKKLGYQTFSKWINEDYDLLPDSQRMDAIIKTITEFDKIKDKVSIYKDMEGVLKHNYDVLKYNASKSTPYAYNTVEKVYYEFRSKKII
jgi:hypothetical protein